MESIQAIKKRIQSISSTRQITQSMRLVSTSKVQKARRRMAANAPFLEETRRIVSLLEQNVRHSGHSYIADRPVNRSGVIVLGSDRGLCGGYSVNLGREAMALIEKLGEVKIITVGVKVRDFLRRRKGASIDRSFTGISEKPFFEDAKEIADLTLNWFDKGEVDALYVVYTEFHSMLVQEAKSVKLLPLQQDEQAAAGKFIRYEPGEEAFLGHIIPFYLATYLYGAMLESSACEQSARITSMDTAVKNSDEMINSLTLLYNQARQGAITQEIIEIVSGAGAVL